MLSVPLTWHDQIVGVLNVQTEQPRDFSDHDVAQLGAVADLLAGIIEKGRQQWEAEARVEALKAIDEARSSDSARDPRAAHPTGDGPRLRRPAGRGTAAARPRVA